jgi:hypothetical protein
VKNFQFLLAAWGTVWVIFLAYEISLARRVGHLREEVKRLSNRVSTNDKRV